MLCVFLLLIYQLSKYFFFQLGRLQKISFFLVGTYSLFSMVFVGSGSGFATLLWWDLIAALPATSGDPPG